MTMTMPTRAGYHRLVPAARRPIVVAIGDTGGVAALRVARALAERDGTHLVLVSAVEPPPIYDLEAARPLMLPWTVDEQLSERRHVLHKRLHGLGWTVNQPGCGFLDQPPCTLSRARGVRRCARRTAQRSHRNRLQLRERQCRGRVARASGG